MGRFQDVAHCPPRSRFATPTDIWKGRDTGLFGNKRLDKEFQLLRSTAYTQADSLAKGFGVTPRTIRSDIVKINTVLETNGAHVDMKRGAGYHLQVDDASTFEAFLAKSEHNHRGDPDLTSSGDRMRFLLRLLIGAGDYLSYEELADTIFVGENTLQNYLRQIKDLLADYELALMTKPGVGVKVLGLESAKRRCYMDNVVVRNMHGYVKGFTDEERMLFSGLDLDRLDEIVRSHLMHSELIANDYDFKNLLVHVALMVTRIRLGCTVESDDSLSITPRIGFFIDSTCADLEKEFGIAINQAERTYFYLHLLSNTALKGADINEHLFKADVDELLDVVYENYGFDLRFDTILKKNLLEHLSATFHGKELRVSKKNPLLNTIRTNFPLPFEIALVSTVKVFNTEPYTLSEDEVGYVALHLGAAIERIVPGDHERLKVLLVCCGGKSIEQMLRSRIETLFSDKVEITDAISYGSFKRLQPQDLATTSFIVTMIPIERCPISHVLVDFSLGPQDTGAISRLINSIEADQASKIGMFFDRNLFVHIGKKQSKGAVLKTLCDLLEENGVVDATFIDSVIEREQISDTSINSYFAIPHSMKPKGFKTKVAVAILDHPVEWDTDAKDVRIVFLLAIRTGDRASIEHLYDLLLEITGNRAVQTEIAKTASFDEFIAALPGIES